MPWVNGLCKSRGLGLYVASEVSVALWARLTTPLGGTAIINCEGSHSLADSMLTADTLDRMAVLAQAGYVSVCGDLSQTNTQGTFGNDTARTRVGQLRTFIQGSTSPLRAASGKVHITAGSGGCTDAINFARQNPSQVGAMYLIAPLVDVENFYNNWTDATITQAEVNKAYNGGVDDGGTAFLAAMPTHNPSRTGNQAALAGIPMRLAYSTNDPYIPVSTVTTYADLVNGAGGTATTISQGAVGHAGTGVDPADVVNFFKAHS
jgi:pimeloyl-ACP methyl ester carboxylesterase